MTTRISRMRTLKARTLTIKQNLTTRASTTRILNTIISTMTTLTSRTYTVRTLSPITWTTSTWTTRTIPTLLMFIKANAKKKLFSREKAESFSKIKCNLKQPSLSITNHAVDILVVEIIFTHEIWRKNAKKVKRCNRKFSFDQYYQENARPVGCCRSNRQRKSIRERP